jgi:hypothetical protein
VAELALRRSRWAAPAGCLLSVAVHATGAALLLVLAHGTMIAAPFEPLPIALVAEGPGGPEPGEGPVTAPAAQLPAPRHAHGRRRAVPRPEVVEAPPEPPPAAPAAPATSPPVEIAAPVAVAGAEPAVEPEVARALRVYDAFPSLPDQAVRARPDLDVRVCVSTQGAVSDAVIVRGSADPSSETLRAAILRWRYRPFAPDGTPTPFCHLMRISYRMN